MPPPAAGAADAGEPESTADPVEPGAATAGGTAVTVCWCCLDANAPVRAGCDNSRADVDGTKPGDLVHGGCGCRGSSGFVHVGCIVAAATVNERHFHRCPTCKQDWEGKLELALRREEYRQACNSPADWDPRSWESVTRRLNTKILLAQTLQFHDRLVEALKLADEAREECERFFGEEDEFTLIAKGVLSEVLNELQDHAGALKLVTDVAAVKRRVDGVEDDTTLVALSSLSKTHGNIGNFDLALRLQQEVVAVRRRLNAVAVAAKDEEQSFEQMRLLQDIDNLASCYVDVNQFEMAWPLYDEALEGFRRVLGNDHVDTLACIGNKGEALCRVGKHSAAAPLLESAAAGMRTAMGEDHISYRYLKRWVDCNARDEVGPRMPEFKLEQSTMYERRALSRYKRARHE